MREAILTVLILTVMTLSSAFGASIDRKFGVTGKAGAWVPLQDDFISSTTNSETGIAYGGGIIYGFARDFALEIDVTRAPKIDVEIGGSKAYEGSLTDVAIGFQYRLGSDNRLVPYFGLGADFIKGSLDHAITGANYSLDWTEGGHVSLGLDYFLTRGIALSAEGRYLIAFEGDVKSSGTKVGDYNPMSFIGTIGIKLMLPQDTFW
jgi:outer membrane protein